MQTDYINPNDEEKEEKLANDEETPFAPPTDATHQVPQDHPVKDTDADSDEWYDAGDDAASAELPDRPNHDGPPKGFTQA